jgi:transposase
MATWLDTANQRHHRRIECRPADRLAADLAAMLELPPLPPVTGWHLTTRLGRDYYVRLDSNDYSVHPSVIGRRVEVTADLDQVRATCDGRLVASHQRCWAAHQTITAPEHDQAARALRAIARPPSPPPALDADVEQRKLTDYDRLFGLGEHQVVTR